MKSELAIQSENLERLVLILRDSIDPDKIILFGSRATDNFQIESDYFTTRQNSESGENNFEK